MKIVLQKCYILLQSLIPYEDDDEVKHDKKKTDAVRRLEAEANDLKKVSFSLYN